MANCGAQPLDACPGLGDHTQQGFEPPVGPSRCDPSAPRGGSANFPFPFLALNSGPEVMTTATTTFPASAGSAVAQRPSGRRKPSVKGGPLKLATLRNVDPVSRLRDARERACLCARVAADNKARDVVVLDMRAITPLYDFFVLATGTSRRQIHTIAEEIDAALPRRGRYRLAIEGYEASKWVVQDYGDVVVHVFDPETRDYYALEDLWADAPRVDWERRLTRLLTVEGRPRADDAPPPER